MPHLAMRAKAHFGLTPLDFGLGRRTASETDRPRSRAPQLGAATDHSFTGVLKLSTSGNSSSRGEQSFVCAIPTVDVVDQPRLEEAPKRLVGGGRFVCSLRTGELLVLPSALEGGALPGQRLDAGVFCQGLRQRHVPLVRGACIPLGRRTRAIDDIPNKPALGAVVSDSQRTRAGLHASARALEPACLACGFRDLLFDGGGVAVHRPVEQGALAGRAAPPAIAELSLKSRRRCTRQIMGVKKGVHERVSSEETQ